MLSAVTQFERDLILGNRGAVRRRLVDLSRLRFAAIAKRFP
jgi:hypothetical protein